MSTEQNKKYALQISYMSNEHPFSTIYNGPPSWSPSVIKSDEEFWEWACAMRSGLYDYVVSPMIDDKIVSWPEGMES